MYVNAGELNKRITVYRKPELEEDGYLPENPEPVPVHSCWAKYSQISGTELARNGADFGEARVRFLLRWTSREIDRKMFVRYRGKDYEILYVNTYGDSGEYLELWCRWLSNDSSVEPGPPGRAIGSDRDRE